MKERPILFSAPEVRAILDGRKTQTRRIVKPQHVRNGGDPGDVEVLTRLARELGDPVESNCYGVRFDCDGTGGVVSVPMSCPFGEPGDRLWVRETWYCDNTTAPNWNSGKKIEATPELIAEWRESLYYRADAKETGTCCEVIPECACAEYRTASGQKRSPWRPSIFMPRWASRLTLEVTAVRVERLHAIRGRDVLAEGVDNGKSNPAQGVRWENMQRLAFEDLWCSINGADSWNANPWVWVVEFKRLEAQERAA